MVCYAINMMSSNYDILLYLLNISLFPRWQIENHVSNSYSVQLFRYKGKVAPITSILHHES